MGLFCQRRFSLHAFGDVLEGNDRPHDFVVLDDGGAGIIDGKAAAIFAPEYLVVHVMGHAVLERGINRTLGVRIGRPIRSRMVYQVVMGHAPDLVSRIAQEALAGRV